MWVNLITFYRMNAKVAVSKYLFIVPRSAEVRVAPGQLIPRTRHELGKALSLKTKPPNVGGVISSAESLVPEMTSDEIFSVVRFFNSGRGTEAKGSLSVLHAKIIDRVVELGVQNFSLSQLIGINRYFKKCARIESMILAQQSGLGELKPSELVSLVQVPGVKRDLVCSQFAKRLKTTTCSMYEIASFLNEVSRKKGETINVGFFQLVSLHLKASVAVSKVKPRDLSLIANAFAATNTWSSDLFSIICKKSIEILPQFENEPVSTALLLHAASKINESPQIVITPDLADVFDHFAPHIAANIHAYRKQGKAVAMILYAYGKSEVRPSEMFIKNFAELVKRDLTHYSFQALAMSVYGFSRLRVQDAVLWDQIKQEVVFRGTLGRRKNFASCCSPADVAMLAKGLLGNVFVSKNGQDDEGMVAHVLFRMLKRNDKIIDSKSFCGSLAVLAREKKSTNSINAWVSQQLPALLPTLTSKQLFSVLSSLHRTEFQNKFLASAISREAEKVSDVNLRIKFLCKLSKLRISSQVLLKDSAKIISSHLPSLSIDQLVDAIFAMAELRHRDELFNAKVIQAVLHQLQSSDEPVSDVLLSKLVLATSKLRITDQPRFYDVLMKKIFQVSPDTKSEQICCNILFAIASALGSGDWEDPNGWFPTISRALLANIGSQLTVEGIRQIQILDLTLRMKNISLHDPSLDQLLGRIRSIDTFKTSSPSIEQSSPAHREISRYLSKLGLVHRNEATLGPFSLDILVTETKTIVEVDGPNHFFNESILRTSSSVLKHAIIKHLGFNLHHVPYQEWIQCNSEDKKLAYCADLLQRLQEDSSM